MNYGYIYKTISLLTGKAYIGQKRGQFNPDYLGSGLILKRAINKYGKGKFKLEVIVYAEDKDKLNELEKQYIKEYRSRFGKENLYNIADGGFGGFGHINPAHIGKENGMFGRKHSEESIEKMRLCKEGRVGWSRGLTKETDERMKRVSNSAKNRFKFPVGEDNPAKRPEVRELLSLQKIGRNNPMFGKSGSKNPMFGRHHSPETIEKIRQSKLCNKKGGGLP